MDAIQPPASLLLAASATLEDGEEGGAVVSVHPSVKQRVGEGGAHGDHVENGVKQAEILHIQHGAIDIRRQLEGVERQPTDGENHHHGHQHFGGFPPSAMALRRSTAGANAGFRRANVGAELRPDSCVGEGDDGERQEVLQDQHGDAVHRAVRALPRPLLRAHLRTQEAMG